MVGWKHAPFDLDVILAPTLLRFHARDGRKTGWLSCFVKYGFVAYGDTASAGHSTTVFMLTPNDGYPKPKQPSHQALALARFIADAVTARDRAAGLLEPESC